MKTKIITLIIALVAIATTAHAQTVTVTLDNVKYTLSYNGTAYVDYSPGAIGTLNLRSNIDANARTYTVTRIADGAFFNNKQITGNLVIPNTVTHIGSGAFWGCTGLNGTLTLPDGLLTIGNTAFYRCTGLTGQLNLPATLTSIGSSAFSGCSGFSGSLTLPPLLTEIAAQTFYGIQFTGDLVVPDGVTSIGDDAFNLNKFSSITIGNGVTTIGTRAFRLTAADQLTLGSSVATIGDEAFRYYDDDVHNYTLNIKCLNAIPAALGQNVFQNHTRCLVEVPCGARDAYIRSAGWAQGGALLPLGHNISELCPTTNACINGIYYTLKLYDGTAKVTNKDYTEDYATISYSGDVVIPAEVTYEGTTFTVTEIVDRAFALCQGITSITCFCPVPPQGGGNAFTGVPRIPLYVPCRVVSAYQSNYYYQSKFSVIGIPEYQNVQIGGVYYVLNYCDGTATVTHAGYSEDDSNSGSYSGYVAIPATVTYEGETYVVNRIGNNAFKGCTALTSVTVGDNVYDIGSNAFSDCTALSNVSIGKNVNDIGNNAFKGCTALTSVNIRESVNNIGNNAFDGCTALSSISSERLEPPTLGSDVFSGVPTSAVLNVPCTATEAYLAAAQWQDFNIQGTVLAPINAQIDGVYYVLNPCAGTATVTHAGYDEIANAHYQNSYSGAVTIPATVTHEGRTYDVTRIGQWAFFISLNLTSVIIGENVIHISPYAFNGCSALTSVIIGENVNTINYYAFNSCSSLGSITSLRPVPPTLIGDDVFRNVPTSAVLYVPCSAVETYAAAGGWNRFETIDCETIVLLDDDSEADTKNHELIQANLGEQVGEVNVRIEGRTLYKTGHWNTLMLPFSLSSLAGTPLEDADVRELVPEECAYANGTLTLKFAAASAIEANKPYIVRWAASEENIDNPRFANVFLEDGINVVAPLEGGILFLGTYDTFAVPELELKHYLYMGGDSKLYYPLAPMNINAFRAFFILRDYVAGEPSATGSAKNIVLDFGDGTTAINEELRMKNEESDNGWYSIDGVKLNGEPRKKGVYIVNGKKVVK